MVSTMRSISSSFKSLVSFAIFLTSSDRIICFPYQIQARLPAEAGFRSLPALVRETPPNAPVKVSRIPVRSKIYHDKKKARRGTLRGPFPMPDGGRRISPSCRTSALRRGCRSTEERRGGQEGVSECRARWARYHKKKKQRK